MKMKNVLCTGALLLIFLLTGCTSTDPSPFRKDIGPQPKKAGIAFAVPYIDTHNHLFGGIGLDRDYVAAARTALAKMEHLGIQKMCIMPPPLSPLHPVSFDMDDLIPAVRKTPDRRLLTRSGRNPKMLRGNIRAFETLLSHNAKAKIIWAHVGWCNTGARTPALCRELFMRHPNLYMSFKLSPESLPELRPISSDRKTIRPEWLRLIQDFPERFVIGTDQFYSPPGSRQIGPQKTEATRLFMNLLPPDLARRVGLENPKSLFNL